MAIALQDRKRVTSELKDWLDDVAAYEREFKKWEGRAEKIVDRYRDEKRKSSDSSSKFNILWSNVQTLIPATFSRLPQPDVSRRFRDNDPVGRVASLILERGLDFEIQHYPDFRATMKQSVQDRFLGGRGTAWARYEPHIRAILGSPEDGDQVTDDVDEPQEELEYECAPVDYVHWKDFGHSVARTWEEVTKVWRAVYMTREAILERFGKEKAKAIPMDASPQEVMNSGEYKPGDSLKRAKIYEGWDKTEKKAVWFSKSVKDFIDEKEDPLGLEGFFPCPRPFYATLTNDKLVPVPDFTLYQDQANDLNLLMNRISGLVQSLKVMGGYDASVPMLSRLFTEGENGTLVPVKNWAAFAEKNGLVGCLSLVDLKPIVEALKAAFETFAAMIEFIYQLTGISDIVRGQTDPNETLGAQELKGQFASLRLRDMQNAAAQYATELLQLKAQIMCLKFSPETMVKISAADQLSEADKKLVPQALVLLLGDRAQMPEAESKNPLRSFRIDVSADTLVQFDENAEKQNAVEFLTATGGYLKQVAEVGQVAPQLVPLILELLKWAVTRFKVGKTIEGTIDQAIDDLKKQIAMQQAQPQQDPKLEAEKVKAQAAAQKAQLEVGVAQQKAQIDERRMQVEEQHDMRRMQIDQQAQSQKAAFDQQKQVMQHQQQMRQASMPPRGRTN